jgi:hypothetical protein
MKYNSSKNKNSSMTGGDTAVMSYNMNVFSILAIMGIVINTIFLYLGNNIATSTIWTYGFSILALCGLIISSFASSSSTSSDSFFKKILVNALPGILTICILSAILYQNIAFFIKINDCKVPDEYYTYSSLTSFLIIIQVIVVIKYMRDYLISSSSNTTNENKSIMHIMGNELYNISFIFTIANVGFIAILQVILKLFSTGG